MPRNDGTLSINTPEWALPLFSPARYKGAFGGRGCVHPDTLIETPCGKVKVKDFTGGDVYSWQDGRLVVAQATSAFPCTEEDLFEVVLCDGSSIIVTDEHKFLTPTGWKMLSSLYSGDDVLSQQSLPYLPRTHSECGGFHYKQIRLIRHHSRQIYWDLHVFKTNNYIAHGFVNHNSGKSHLFAEMLVEAHILDQNESSVCIREVQKSLNQSVKRLLELKIEQMNAGDYFEVQESCIKSKRGNGMIIFQGLQNHTADTIKSLQGYKRAWVEEAQSLSQRSLDLLRPTIREDGSELWFTWNPNDQDDPIDQLLRGENPPPGAIVLPVNYEDNPWFPDVLREEMEYDRSRDIDRYNHVWLGHYRAASEARVFKNWVIEDFERPAGTVYRLGADWGFSVDPSVLVRCSMDGNRLYIDHEAYMVGCEITGLPDLFDRVPESRKWFCRADSARPEVIDYMRKHGYPKMQSAQKGAGSIEEGIQFLQSYDIVVHPRCKHVIDELNTYSYKRDPRTNEILPILEDKNNHMIDAIRYACEGVRKASPVRRTIVNSQRYAGPSFTSWMGS